MPRISLPMPTPLARAARRFQEWREQRTTHHIPEELWTLAAGLGRRYGVNRTARTLGVQDLELQTRVGPAESIPLPELQSTSPSFGMFLAPPPTGHLLTSHGVLSGAGRGGERIVPEALQVEEASHASLPRTLRLK